jgi:hypothetical protein
MTILYIQNILEIVKKENRTDIWHISLSIWYFISPVSRYAIGYNKLKIYVKQITTTSNLAHWQNKRFE